MNIEADGLELSPSLSIGIPAGRDISWTQRILSRLESPATQVEVLVARWSKTPLTDEDLQRLNKYFPTKEVQSQARHAPAMRNAIVREAQTTHLLFLDDDMVPEPDLLYHALQLAGREPNIVHQGIPYLVANSHNWLARTEGKVYQKSFSRYLTADNQVSLLDARLMLVPVDVLLKTPFNESMAAGGGEGHELARCLIEQGIPLRLGTELLGGHTNRETLMGLIAQKRAHGRGRGYMLLNEGPGEKGWIEYIKTYIGRHLLEPAKDWRKGELNTEELMYVWGTYSVHWLGVIEEIMQAKMSFINSIFFR